MISIDIHKQVASITVQHPSYPANSTTELGFIYWYKLWSVDVIIAFWSGYFSGSQLINWKHLSAHSPSSQGPWLIITAEGCKGISFAKGGDCAQNLSGAYVLWGLP